MIASLLARLSRLGRPFSEREIFDLARQYKYDGSITFHFKGGIPKRFEAGRPVQGEIALDKPASSSAPSKMVATSLSQGA